jgi:hypothetical protein
MVARVGGLRAMRLYKRLGMGMINHYLYQLEPIFRDRHNRKTSHSLTPMCQPVCPKCLWGSIKLQNFFADTGYLFTLKRLIRT